MEASVLDEHVIEVLGKTRVVISHGSIVDIGEPKIRYCPLAEKFPKSVKKICKESVFEHVKWCIENYGLCTANRVLEADESFVEFGASETLYTCLKREFLDCCIIVGDCVGTVITKNAKVVQGLGGKLSGVIETTPISAVIEKLKALDSRPYRDGEINQFKGFEKAVNLGFKSIGVTVTSADDAMKIRRLAKRDHVTSLIIGVHLTGISRNETLQLLENSDVVTGCASKYVRNMAAENCMLQVGTSMPVYALTRIGREALLERAKDVRRELSIKIGVEKTHQLSVKTPCPLV